MARAVTPFRALRSTLHVLRAGLRSTLHALRISLLLRDRIRPIARHTELRDELGDHVASTPSFGNERTRARAHVGFIHRGHLRTGNHDDDLPSWRRILVVRAKRTDRSAP